MSTGVTMLAWLKANIGWLALALALAALVLVFYHHHDHAERAVYLGP